MKYQYLDYDPAHYSYRLSLDKENATLQWRGAPQQDALLVQTPVGWDAITYIQKFCAREGELPFPHDSEYLAMEHGIFFRFVTAMERRRKHGCPLNGLACQYTVFSCQMDDGMCRIFAPKSQADDPMNPVSCVVRREVCVRVKPVVIDPGFFGRLFHSGERNLVYQVSFPEREELCEDGDLYYQADGFTYPILREMYRQGCFYVRATDEPVVKSRNKGLDILRL